MQIAGLILGILGGLAGLGAGVIALVASGASFAVGADSARAMAEASGSMFTCSIVGIIGGALALSRPVWAGWLQLIAGVGGLVSFSAMWLPAFPL